MKLQDTESQADSAAVEIIDMSSTKPGLEHMLSELRQSALAESQTMSDAEVEKTTFDREFNKFDRDFNKFDRDPGPTKEKRSK
jgi:hypothetical protein